MKRIVVFIILSCLCTWQAIAADYRYERNIAYRQTNDAYADSMCRLDIAYPANAKEAPVVVWFHGGGLTGGKREIPEALLKEGLIVVGVEYRLSPKVTIPEIIDDATQAVSWTFDHIAQYGGSTQKIYLSGHSAGGYLIDLVGLNKSLLKKYGKDADQIAGLIPFSGQVITHFEARRRMGMPPLQPLIDSIAPLYYVRKDCPPILIISADREKELYGRYEEQAFFHRLFKLLGHPDATLYELDGYDHGNMPIASFPLLLQFIREHEKK